MTQPISPALRSRLAKATKTVSLEKYFQAEEKALCKHEFHNGIIIKMAGGTFNHDNIAGRAITFMNIFVETNDLNYFVNGSDTKIRIADYDKVVYADALVICEKPIYFEDRKDTIVNPLIIVEVASPDPSRRGESDKIVKFDYYRSLESFKEYVLVQQKRKQVTVYTKQDDGTWLLRDYIGDESVAILHALHGCPIELKKLYKDLEL
jgi:Uma2 family endonuclease